MMTIRARLLVMLLPALALVLLAGGAAVYWVAQTSLLRQLDARLTARAQMLASLVLYEDGRVIYELEDGPVEAVAEGNFEFTTLAGDTLERSANLGETDLFKRALGPRDTIFDDVVLPGNVRARAVWMKFTPRVEDEHASESSSPPDDMVVIAAIDRSPIDRALTTLLGALLLVGGVVAIAACVLIALAVRWGLGPLRRLGNELEGVGGPTISTRFDDSGVSRDLAPVYQELNRMLDRVELTLQRERAFADAAAHELRTPLAELRTTAEVAIRWTDPQRAVAALHEALNIGREMERLVESLLLISRANAVAAPGNDHATHESKGTPLAPLVQGCLDRLNGSIHGRDVNVTVELEARSTLQAPRDALEIIVRNLLDNAIQYTPTHGSITITTTHGGNGSYSLMIENGPVDLRESDLPRLFEPFSRAQQSHSDRNHVGLGLTVVQRIAHASGLHIDAALAGDRLQMRVCAAK